MDYQLSSNEITMVIEYTLCPVKKRTPWTTSNKNVKSNEYE